MTLNQTWKNCLRMWKWIAKVWESGVHIEDLKREWLKRYKPQLILDSNCFFCDHDGCFEQNDYDENCLFCPGKLVNKRFNCLNNSYHYQNKPKKFYQKLLQLDAKRRNNGQG